MASNGNASLAHCQFSALLPSPSGVEGAASTAAFPVLSLPLPLPQVTCAETEAPPLPPPTEAEAPPLPPPTEPKVPPLPHPTGVGGMCVDEPNSVQLIRASVPVCRSPPCSEFSSAAEFGVIGDVTITSWGCVHACERCEDIRALQVDDRQVNPHNTHPKESKVGFTGW